MGSANKERLLYGLVNNRLSLGSFNGRPRPELGKDFLSRARRECSAAAPMKEALQRFAAYATGSTSKERLLYGPTTVSFTDVMVSHAQNYGCVSTALMEDIEALQRFARAP